MLDDQDHDLNGSLKLNSRTLLLFLLLFLLISIGGTTLLFYLTPIGSLYKDRQEERIRSEVIKIGERIIQLEDSLNVRNQQLENMKAVIRDNQDTTYQISRRLQTDEIVSGTEQLLLGYSTDWYSEESVRLLTTNEIRTSTENSELSFSKFRLPADGLLSQGFSPVTGHFGIDIATQEGAFFRSVGSGTIIHASWTFETGYVIQIQHPDGTVSIYKHASQVNKEIGEFVVKGEVLGRVGNKGVLSSGPHLHLEIWKDGVPMDPKKYLLN